LMRVSLWIKLEGLFLMLIPTLRDCAQHSRYLIYATYASTVTRALPVALWSFLIGAIGHSRQHSQNLENK
jgi:hypothetical protein